MSLTTIFEVQSEDRGRLDASAAVDLLRELI